MNKSVNAYIVAVALAAVATLLALWPYSALYSMPPERLLGAGVLVGLAFVSEGLAFYFGNKQLIASSVAFLPFLACVILFPPAVAVPAIGAAVLASNIFPHRRSFFKLLFNVSQAIVSAGCAAIINETLLSAHIKPIWSFAAATLAFLTINMALMAGVLAVMRGQRFSLVAAEVVGPKGNNFIRGLLASPLALFIAPLYENYQITGIISVLLPLMLIRHSYADRLELERANKDLLRVLIKAIDTRDPYTSGHSFRVASLAIMIAEDLKLPRRRIDEIEMAALLHDVGKIDPAFEAVIRKPYDLTNEERALIQTHAALGADILRNLKTLPDVIVTSVRHHHERMDGKGYPAGLVGTDIPLPARIIMLCDSIDAMLSDRPYRKALPIDRVRQELVRCAGSQFDPAIVHVVLQRDTLERAANLVDRISGIEDEYLIRVQA